MVQTNNNFRYAMNAIILSLSKKIKSAQIASNIMRSTESMNILKKARQDKLKIYPQLKK